MEIIVPHVSLKHFPAQVDEPTKERLSKGLTDAVVAALDCDPSVVSIAMEPIPQEEWDARVYEPEIVGKRELLIRRPGYGSLNEAD